MLSSRLYWNFSPHPASSMEAKITPSSIYRYTSDSLCPNVSNSASSQAKSCSSTVCSLSGVYKLHGRSLQNVYFYVVPANVTFETKSVITYAFLDQGSTHSFCHNALVNTLDLHGDANKFTLQTLTGTKANSGINVSLSVSSLNGNESFLPNPTVILLRCFLSSKYVCQFIKQFISEMK